MAVAIEAWRGLMRGSSLAELVTWTLSWGDPWLASYTGSTAMLDGGAPAAWTAQGMAEDPESLFRLARQAGWDYAAAVTPEGPTPERVAAQCIERCRDQTDPTQRSICLANCQGGGLQPTQGLPGVVGWGQELLKVSGDLVRVLLLVGLLIVLVLVFK